jgi:RNA polymerase primary sigma factor
MRNQGRHMSMDAPLGNMEDGGSMYELLENKHEAAPDNDLIIESLRSEINRALTGLTPREADVVRLYYGLSGGHSHSLEEIGEKFELTRERVRQIKEKAVRRLKHASRSKFLMGYLG